MPVVFCPQCHARYNIPAAQLGPQGRTLKCAKCANRWFVPPEEPAPETPAPAEAEMPAESRAEAPAETPGDVSAVGNGPAKMEEREESAPTEAEEEAPAPSLDAMVAMKSRSPRVGTKPFALSVWGVLSAAVVLLFVGATAWVMLDFTGVKLTVPDFKPVAIPAGQPEHLVIEGLKPSLLAAGETTLLDVTGTLTNTADTSATLPELRVELLDARGAVLDFWPADISASVLFPHESLAFVARFKNPPLERMVAFRAFFRPKSAVVPYPAPSATQPAPAHPPSPSPTKKVDGHRAK